MAGRFWLRILFIRWEIIRHVVHCQNMGETSLGLNRFRQVTAMCFIVQGGKPLLAYVEKSDYALTALIECTAPSSVYTNFWIVHGEPLFENYCLRASGNHQVHRCVSFAVA